jgi:hypothetical protein
MINSRTGQDSKDWVKFESCMIQVQRISYFLLLNQLPYTPQDRSYKDMVHIGPNMTDVCICKYSQNAHNLSRKQFLTT